MACSRAHFTFILFLFCLDEVAPTSGCISAGREAAFYACLSVPNTHRIEFGSRIGLGVVAVESRACHCRK